MRTSCISWPPNEPLVLIRTSQLRICEGNHCAAALLSYFEHWHNIKLTNRSQAEHANRIAQQHEDRGMQDTSLLQFHTELDIEQGLLGLYGRKTIRIALDTIVEKGFVTIHKNPNKRYHFDHTRYFLFHPEVVMAQLVDISVEVKMPEREGHFTSSSGKNTSSSGIFTSTIPEITPEITSEIPEEESQISSEIVGGTGNSISIPPTMNGTHACVALEGKKKKSRVRKIRRLEEEDWLWQELQHYQDEFDLDALNDAAWWDNVANSFPTFDKTWVPMAFASLAQWQMSHPKEVPRSPQGWKRQVGYSLNFYYDKHYRRRERYGKASTYPHSR